MYKYPGEKAEIHCSHSIQSYDQILWYKKLQNRQLKLLGYIVGDSTFPETGVQVKMHGNANKDQNCTLITEELNLNSSAVYFCAARYHSATYRCSSIQKCSHHCITAHSTLHLFSFIRQWYIFHHSLSQWFVEVFDIMTVGYENSMTTPT